MNLEVTDIYRQLSDAWNVGERHIWLEGGTAASKTYSVLQLLAVVGLSYRAPLLISIVSESIPHLKRGCLRDWVNVLGNSYNPKKMNRSDLVYDFGNGKPKIEFFGADAPDKLRGARRDVLFLNEANNIPYDAYRELDSRTKIRTICDWNPVSEFWFHLNGHDKEGQYIHATYRDAREVIPDSIVENILKMGERDPNWANVYLEGKLGKITGLVYPFFSQVDEYPLNGFDFYGLDFGFSSDPSVLVKNNILGDRLTSRELFYESGMTNPDIAHRMTELGVRKNHDLIYADSAEPKSIAEIKGYGFNIKGCPKGADSVEYGHQKIRQYVQYWTKDSINCIKEQRNFRYIADSNGKLTKKTMHNFSHGMDARRYGVLGVTGVEEKKGVAVYDAMELVEDMDL